VIHDNLWLSKNRAEAVVEYLTLETKDLEISRKKLRE